MGPCGLYWYWSFVSDVVLTETKWAIRNTQKEGRYKWPIRQRWTCSENLQCCLIAYFALLHGEIALFGYKSWFCRTPFLYTTLLTLLVVTYNSTQKICHIPPAKIIRSLCRLCILLHLRYIYIHGYLMSESVYVRFSSHWHYLVPYSTSTITIKWY